MKLAIVYDSKTGHTEKMAQYIIEGIESVQGAQAKAFSINNVDLDYTKECCALIVDTPTYHGYLSARMKQWLETGLGKLGMSGKLGGAYATATYIHGGGDLAIQCILTHMMVDGMMTYSGGHAKGKPIIHLGPVAIDSNLDDFADLFRTYGKRMAEQAAALQQA